MYESTLYWFICYTLLELKNRLYFVFISSIETIELMLMCAALRTNAKRYYSLLSQCWLCPTSEIQRQIFELTAEYKTKFFFPMTSSLMFDSEKARPMSSVKRQLFKLNYLLKIPHRSVQRKFPQWFREFSKALDFCKIVTERTFIFKMTFQ